MPRSPSTTTRTGRCGGCVASQRRRGAPSSVRARLGEFVVPTLNRLVTLGPEASPAPAPCARCLQYARDEVLGRFIDAALLRDSELDGESVVDVAHEALLRQWPRGRSRSSVIARRAAAVTNRAGTEMGATRRHEILVPGERLVVANLLSGSPRVVRVISPRCSERFWPPVRIASAGRKCQRSDSARLRQPGGACSSSARLPSSRSSSGQANDERARATITKYTRRQSGWRPMRWVSSQGTRAEPCGRHAGYAKKHTLLTEGALRVATSQATPQLVLRGHHGSVNDARSRGMDFIASAAATGPCAYGTGAPRALHDILRGHRGFVSDVALRVTDVISQAGGDGTVRVWVGAARAPRPRSCAGTAGR